MMWNFTLTTSWCIFSWGDPNVYITFWKILVKIKEGREGYTHWTKRFGETAVVIWEDFKNVSLLYAWYQLKLFCYLGETIKCKYMLKGDNPK